MTDRFHSLTVVLAHDIRDDDAESIMTAIRQLRGVINVSGIVADTNSHMALERARFELADKLWGVLYPKNKLL
jgi:hypothetical protein